MEVVKRMKVMKDSVVCTVPSVLRMVSASSALIPLFSSKVNVIQENNATMEIYTLTKQQRHAFTVMNIVDTMDVRDLLEVIVTSAKMVT